MDQALAPRRYRAVFISDIHLGTRGCQAELLLDFIRHIECDQLYLVGDSQRRRLGGELHRPGGTFRRPT